MPDITLLEGSFLGDGDGLSGPEFSDTVQQKSAFPEHLMRGAFYAPSRVNCNN